MTSNFLSARAGVLFFWKNEGWNLWVEVSSHEADLRFYYYYIKKKKKNVLQKKYIGTLYIRTFGTWGTRI